jgi:hypothetical protein
MPGPNDFNTAIIDEFRANDGKVSGGFEGAPMLLLHSKGAKSGVERVNPVVYQTVGDDYVIFCIEGRRADEPGLVSQPGSQPRDQHRGRIRDDSCHGARG